jgi:glycosyltransferase involved in cell wall biosynthesis
MVCITTHGTIQAETAEAFAEMRALAVAEGLKNVVWRFVHGGLVDKARNEAARNLLAHQPRLEWILFLDGDMLFEPQLVKQMLLTAYNEADWASIVGGYCQLRGTPNLPTIDTGTGTWEPIEAATGLYEAIRTGAACMLVKRIVFETLNFPWFGIRIVPRPLDALLEVDNYARCKLDGKNPFFEHEDWSKLLVAARQDAYNQRSVTDGVPGWEYHTVGEDSGLSDRAKAAGFRIVVNSNVIVGHVDKKVIRPEDLTKGMQEMRREMALAAGVAP